MTKNYIQTIFFKLFQKSYRFFFFLLFLILFSLSCGSVNEEQLESQGSGLPLLEPAIVTGNPQLISTLSGENQRSTALNGLMDNIQKSTFYINDYLEFEKKEGKSQDIQFHITTQCIESENQNKFIKNIITPFKQKIYLIEMLPEKIFSYGKRWWLSPEIKNPTCNFYFKATNKVGDIHYFELPHLPISLFEHSWNLSLIDKNQTMKADIELSKAFPLLMMKNIVDYKLISHSASKIDKLKLICEDAEDIIFNVNNQQQYDLWGLQGWSQVSFGSSASKACRFLSLNEDQIIGISQVFPLIPLVASDTFDVQKIDNLISDNASLGEKIKETKFPEVDDNTPRLNLASLLKNITSPINSSIPPLYFDIMGLRLNNHGKEPLYLLLPQTSMPADLNLFFADIYHKVRPDKTLDLGKIQRMGRLNYFIRKEEGASFVLGQFMFNDFLNKESRSVKDQLDNGNQVIYGVYEKQTYALVTIQPQSLITLNFGLVISDPNLCLQINDEGGIETDVIGMILESEYLPIYRVLNNSDFKLASQTIIQKYNWRKGSAVEPEPFRWELWNQQLRHRKHEYTGSYYKNTCGGGTSDYFSAATQEEPLSWFISFNNSDKYGRTANAEKRTESFKEAVDKFLAVKKKESEKEERNYRKNKRKKKEKADKKELEELRQYKKEREAAEVARILFLIDGNRYGQPRR